MNRTIIILLCGLLCGCQYKKDYQTEEISPLHEVDSIVIMRIGFHVLTTVNISRGRFSGEYNTCILSRCGHAKSCCLRQEKMSNLLTMIEDLELDTTLVMYNEYDALLKQNGEYVLMDNDPLDVRCLILLYRRHSSIPIWVSNFNTYYNGSYYITSDSLKTYIENL